MVWMKLKYWIGFDLVKNHGLRGKASKIEGTAGIKIFKNLHISSTQSHKSAP